MSSNISILRNTESSATLQRLPLIKPKCCIVALSTIAIIGSLLAIGFGIDGLMGGISHLDHVKSIILISSGAVLLVGLAIVSVVKGHKKQADTNIDSKKEISEEEFKRGLDQWVNSADPYYRSNYVRAAEIILNCFQNRSDNLSLRGMQLVSLPPEIGFLTNLKTLDLSVNELTSLPPEIGSLTNLENLSLYSNRLTSLPPEISSLTNLEYLKLGRNQLTSLPPEISSLINLKNLDLDSNRLTSLPPEIGSLTNLENLSLYSNQLTSLPPKIDSLTNLKELNLSNNRLTSLPPEIGSLTNLNELYLSNNQLTSLPPKIDSLTNLKELDLANNQLTSLPSEISSLTNLKELDLANNRLTSLPDGISQLASLTSLMLDSNPISSLPVELLFMQSALQITITNCGFSQRSLQDLQVRLNAPNYNGPRIYFSIRETRRVENRTINELLEEVTFSAKWKNKLSLENLTQDPENTENLRSWLARLSAIGDYKNKRESLALLVCQILEKAETDPAFRDIFWGCLMDASSTCGDRMALSLLYLGIHYEISECAKEKNLAKLAYLLGHGLWALDQLEKIAKKKVESLACVDEIEVYLAYPIMLKEKLKLPIVLDSMLYFACSAVTQGDLDSAEADVKTSLTDQDAYCRYLARSEIWLKTLETSGIEEYSKLVNQKHTAIGKLDEDADPGAYQQIESEFIQGLVTLTQQVLAQEGLPPFLAKKS